MLWYKAWLETRWGLVFFCGLYLFVWTVAFTSAGKANSTAENVAGPMDVFAFSWIAVAMSFAGTGCKTQAAGFQNNKGLHGSSQYTLSLPVSRLRLVAVRTAVGLIETIGLITVFCVAAWFMGPEITAHSTPRDRLAYLLVSFICSSTFYFISMFLGTFLDDHLRIPGVMAALAILIALDLTNVLPHYVNIFRPMGSGSPLVTHTIPWATLAVAIAASAGFFLAGVEMVQIQEY